LSGENTISGNGNQALVSAKEKSFYLYKHLEKKHSDFQKVIQQNKYHNVLLIMKTPGSLEHFMAHTDPEIFYEIFMNRLKYLTLAHTWKAWRELPAWWICWMVNYGWNRCQAKEPPGGLPLMYNRHTQGIIPTRNCLIQDHFRTGPARQS